MNLVKIVKNFNKFEYKLCVCKIIFKKTTKNKPTPLHSTPLQNKMKQNQNLNKPKTGSEHLNLRGNLSAYNTFFEPCITLGHCLSRHYCKSLV